MIRPSGNTLPILLILFSFAAIPAAAQQTAELQTPSQFLGVDVGGDRVLVGWQQMLSYCQYIDDESERVTIRELGESSEGRKMITVLISSPGNLARLDEIMEIQHELTFNPDQAQTAGLLADQPALVLFNMSLHATEVGPAQFSVKLLHWLASADESEVGGILDNTVLSLIPTPNPDGLDMVTEWYNRYLDSGHEGMSQPWLYQKYAGHDNNRDWFMLNLLETRNVTRWISEFLPVVIWDAHQMGSSGFRAIIPPFVGPPNQVLHPLVLTGIENAGHSMKQQVVREEQGGVAHSYIFSVWWNGGFRTVPYYKNMIGILSELASARLASPREIPLEQLENGRMDYTQKTVLNPLPWLGGRWGLPEIVAYHQSLAAGLLNYCALNARQINADFRRMNLDAMMLKQEGPAGYLIPADQFDRTALARLLDILDRHQISVQQITEQIELQGLAYPAGTYAVSGAQPFRPMIRSLLEPQRYPEVRDQQGREQNPYDLTAWNLNHMMGLEVVPIDAESWEKAGLDRLMKPAVMPSSEVMSTSAGMTFLPARDLENYRRAISYLKEKTSTWAEMTPGETGEADQFVVYDPGRDATAMDLSGVIAEAEERSLSLPRLGLLIGFYGSMDSGWTEWVFDQAGLPYSDLTSKRIKAGDLHEDYDVIVIPSFSERRLLEGRGENYPEEYRSGIGRLGLQQLEEFVLRGGRLISLDRSSGIFIKYFGLPVVDSLRGIDSETLHVPGSLLALEVPHENAIAFGMNGGSAALFRWSGAFEVPESREDAESLVNYAQEDLLLSGFMKGGELLAGKSAVALAKHGEGDVVLFAFPPQFRGQTYGTFKLLLNAILFAERGPEQVEGLKAE